jgi:hypothetical protein
MKFFLLLLLAILAPVDFATAQDFDVLVQQSAGKLVTGFVDFDNGSYNIGPRIFTSRFSSTFVSNNPGVNSVANTSTNLPPGTSALPGNTQLHWDFLPMSVGAVKSNLLYWNGSGPVSFSSTPASPYRLSLSGVSETAWADGSSQLITGANFRTTPTSGAFHTHRFFTLDDGDNNGATTPQAGVYLIAMQWRMAGLTTSDPFYVAFGTLGLPTSVLETNVAPWLIARQDLLVRSGPPGDFTGDGRVDAADYTAWRDTLGSTTALAADANLNFAIDAEDYQAWRLNFGAGSAAFTVAASVPEPRALVPLLVALFVPLLPRLTSGAHDPLRCNP